MYPIRFPMDQNGIYDFYSNHLFPAIAENGPLLQLAQQMRPCEIPENFYSSYMKMNNNGQSFYLASLDYTHNFINTSKAFQDKIYNEFYGPPGLSKTESKKHQNPLDRYFALKRILILPADASSHPSVDIKRKRAIQKEMQKVSEIIRRGPPKVVECPPWSKGIKPFCNIKSSEMDENTDTETKPSQLPKSQEPKRAGIRICLSTHVVDNDRSVTSQEVFYPFSSSETISDTNITATNHFSRNLQNIPEDSNSK